MCLELTDFCDMTQLADGRFCQSVCFLTWAPVSQVQTLRLCAIFLERRAAPPQVRSPPKTGPIVYKKLCFSPDTTRHQPE